MEASARYNLALSRDVYVLSDPHHFEVVRTMIKAHYFLLPKPFAMMPEHLEEPHFVLCVVDFADAQACQEFVSTMTELTSPLAHKVVYAVNPDNLSSEFLLLAQEVGVRFVAFGMTKVEDLKDYFKRVCVEENKIGSLDYFSREFAAAYRTLDKERIHKTIARLKETGAEGEETHRLLAQAYMKLGETKLAEYQLKQILHNNRQNLWAANMLGRLLLAAGRASEGVEILERLSLFHELNGERYLTLGHAYADVGEVERAEDMFRAGSALQFGHDKRFRAGLAKVKLAQGDVAGALKLTGKAGFSEELIRFLNMRAILAMRRDKIAQALIYYQQALEGSVDNLIKAKLYFNMGLACVKNGDLFAARGHLEKSVALGGPAFSRATGPLDIVNAVLTKARREQVEPIYEAAADMMDDVAFETMF